MPEPTACSRALSPAQPGQDPLTLKTLQTQSKKNKVC